MNDKDAYIAHLEKTIENLQNQVNNLTEMIMLLRKEKFGSSSEKTKKQQLEGQLSLFNEAESEADASYQKYVNSIPLYRQEKDWEQLGISLSRATLANWTIRCAQDYLFPVIDHLRKELLKRDILHCDETPVQVLKEEGRKPQSKSYMWLYRTGMMEKLQLSCTITSLPEMEITR